MPSVRKATAADVDALAQVTARAFESDPFWRFLFPSGDFMQRAIRLASFELRHMHLRNDEVWTTTGEIQGAAMWAPPNKWRQSTSEAIRTAPSMLRIFGPHALKLLSTMNAIEKAHPPGPHYYLAVLGTDPTHQGQGVGSACLEPVLERCDEQGVGAYLESSKESNIAFYNRHGFELTRKLDLPAGAPPLWAMWREPK